MRTTEMVSTAPIAVEKSVRSDELRSLSSANAGLIIPLAFVPLLREDRVTSGNVTVSADMAETLYPLLNAVSLSVQAHFIANVAYERFDGMDSFNRSYQGVAEPSTSTVIPFMPQVAFAKAAPIWRALGVYWPEGEMINRAPIEAYNLLVNWKRRLRSDKLPQRVLTDTTLAEAFWRHTVVNEVVPDFDQSLNEGEVPLEFATQRMWIEGIGRLTAGNPTELTNQAVTEKRAGSTTEEVIYPYALNPGDANLRVLTGAQGIPQLFADLEASGVKLSLANIELAKKTAAFAKLRERYKGLEDDHIIDLLMEGIRVPDEALKQPILLASKSAVFGYTERHAMDGASLDESLTTGKTRVNLRFRTPPMNTGGVILITAQITPEQLYERMRDQWLAITDTNSYPNFMRDYLDPEKVEVVQNRYVDVLHSQPTATFGYGPLNHKWRRSFTRTGGKFYRPFPDTFVEDRQRFWSADQVDPTLMDDFYMVSDLPNSVFADTESEPFEILTLGAVNIVGNTVFGPRLSEDIGSYEEVMDEVDTDRLVIDPVPVAAAAASPEAGSAEPQAKKAKS